MNEKKGSSYVVSTTLAKAFAILESIAQHQPVRPPVIQREVGLTKGNAHHLLASLEHLGYVERTEDGYRLTFRMFAIGNAALLGRDVTTLARPVMNRLAEEEGVHVYLTGRSRLEMVNLHRVQPRRDIQVANDYAVTYELHCTASGKLWLSFMTPEERRRAYEEMSFNKRTEHTITDPGKLEQEVLRVAERGYALELTEHSPYINGLAAPVFDHRGEIAASLSVIGPTPILTMEELERLTPRVIADAREISRLMGYEQA